MDFWDKYYNNLLTIEDQKEALTNSWLSYCFASANIPGSDFKALQAKACEDPWYAYIFARDVPGADIKYCQKYACKWDKYENNLLTIEDQKEALTNSWLSYCFALANIPGSDFKALQTKACEDPYFAYMFAYHIPGADIKYCQKYACKDPIYAYYFAIDIPSANKKYCFKRTFPEKEYGPDRWKSEYNKFIMQKACE